MISRQRSRKGIFMIELMVYLKVNCNSYVLLHPFQRNMREIKIICTISQSWFYISSSGGISQPNQTCSQITAVNDLSQYLSEFTDVSVKIMTSNIKYHKSAQQILTAYLPG